MYAVLLKPSPRDRDGFIQHGVDMFTKIGGSGFEPDIEDLRDIATRSYDRGHDPRGSQRQLAAIIADRDRTPQLRRLTIPATVIHGADDKLVRPSGGRATAKAIPGAKPGRDRRHGPRPAARRLADRSSARSPTPRRAARPPPRRSHQYEDEHDHDQDQDRGAA